MSDTTDTDSKKSRVRLRDVAEEAEVSVTAVSMALADHPNISDETKRRVESISRRLGYEPKNGRRKHASAPSSLEGQRIGLLLLGSTVGERVYAAMLQGATAQARKLGSRLEISAVETRDPRECERAAMEFSQGLAGLIVSGYISNSLMQRLHEASIPAVVIGSTLDEPAVAKTPCYRVAPSYYQMADLAVGALYDRGHRRIAFVGELIPPGLADEQLLSGYRMAMQRRGLPLDDALVQLSGEVCSGGGPAAKAIAALKDPPTAYFTLSVEFAVSLQNALAGEGIETYPTAFATIEADPRKVLEQNLGGCVLIDDRQRQLSELAIDTLGRIMSKTLPQGIDFVLQPQLCNA